MILTQKEIDYWVIKSDNNWFFQFMLTSNMHTSSAFLAYADYVGLKQHFQHFFQIIFLYSIANTSKSHPSFLPQECRGSRALQENWATQERLGLLETEVQQSHFNLKFRFDMQFNTVSCQSQCFSSLSVHPSVWNHTVKPYYCITHSSVIFTIK